MSEESTRAQLFGDDGKPRQRTADEIKAAYGHAPKAVVSFNFIPPDIGNPAHSDFSISKWILCYMLLFKFLYTSV